MRNCGRQTLSGLALLGVLGGMAVPCAAQAPEDAPSNPWDLPRLTASLAHRPQVQVDVMMVSLPDAKAISLLPLLRNPGAIAGAVDQILGMIASKEAQLIDWPELTTHSGTRAWSEAIVEKRYPSEFDQPQEAQTFGVAPKVHRTAAEEAIRTLRLAGLLVPVTFETRNTGQSFEVEAVVSPDGKTATIRCSPQVVRLTRMVQFPTMPANEGSRLSVAQPVFATDKVHLQVTLRHDERRLIYVGKKSETPDRMEVFILGLRIIPPVALRQSE